jgi:hypothetical protein
MSRGRFSCRPPLGVRRRVVHRTILRSRAPPGGAAQSNQVVAYSPGLAGCAGVSLPTPRRRYPLSRPPSVRGAHLECRFRSSPPTHHGGDRTRRRDGESRPCRRTTSGLPAQGRPGPAAVASAASSPPRDVALAGGAGAPLEGGPFGSVQRRSAGHAPSARTAQAAPTDVGDRRGARAGSGLGRPRLGASGRPKRPPWCSAARPWPSRGRPRRSPSRMRPADHPTVAPHDRRRPQTPHFSRAREDDTPGVAHDQGW